MENGQRDVARDFRIVKRKAMLVGAGSTLMALGLFGMLASAIVRGARRARRRSAFWFSGATSMLGVVGLLSAKKLLKHDYVSPDLAKARIKHAVSAAARAMS